MREIPKEAKILLIEDNETIILGLTYLFYNKKLGLEIAKTKKEAMQKLERGKFDCILLDITLPDGNGFHGFHIHDGNSCEPMMEGGHYNPTNKPHSQHVGDMPPLLANDGVAFSGFYTKRFYPEDIVGKVVVIHCNPDDFVSQPSGNPGSIIACGEIKELEV